MTLCLLNTTPPRHYADFFTKNSINHLTQSFKETLNDLLQSMPSNDLRYISECFCSILKGPSESTDPIYRAIDLYVAPYLLISDPKSFVLNQKAFLLIDRVANIEKMAYLSSFSSQWKKFQKQRFLLEHCVSIVLYVVKFLSEGKPLVYAWSRLKDLKEIPSSSAKKAKITFLKKICTQNPSFHWDRPKDRVLTFFSTGIHPHLYQTHFTEEAFHLLPGPIQTDLIKRFDPLNRSTKCKHFSYLCKALKIRSFSDRDVLFTSLLIVSKNKNRFLPFNLKVFAKENSPDNICIIARLYYERYLQPTSSFPLYYYTQYLSERDSQEI